MLAADLPTLTTYMGQEIDPAHGHVALDMAAAFVRNYTRGNGYLPAGHPNEELATVTLSLAARLMTNPEGLVNKTVTIDDATVTKAFGQVGVTLLERMTLNRYRARAM
ncbi:hypothetical protein AADG42_06595 [Ammonicoccus fulvus]|uniref:Uncharacterized protein n=1 Tax=Ammonicoccus fulvus TaxID=3138240 RepID=A0ABZ3FLS8_9ACTN